MKLIESLSKEGLKFKKKRKEKMETSSPREAAKKRWWEKLNMGKNIGSNKKGVSKKSY